MTRLSLKICRSSFRRNVHGTSLIANIQSLWLCQYGNFSVRRCQTAQDSYQVCGKYYETHIPTNTLQKALLTAGSAFIAIRNPQRGDMVATMGEASGYMAIKYMQRVMMADQEGRQILHEEPRINSNTVDLDQLQTLPEGTLGKEYALWLDKNNASPDERLPVQFVDNPDLAYVMTRYRETHDLYHAVLGMPTNMIGEVTVKWVEALQTGLPMCALGGLFGPLRLGPKHRQLYFSTHLNWALKTGLYSKNLMCVYYEKYWDYSLQDLRTMWRITAPPSTPERRF